MSWIGKESVRKRGAACGALPRRREGRLAGIRVREGIGRKRDERGGTARSGKGGLAESRGVREADQWQGTGNKEGAEGDRGG